MGRLVNMSRLAILAEAAKVDTPASSGGGFVGPTGGFAFPVDVNRASRETLLRVPGLGMKSVEKLIRMRRVASLRLADVGRLTRSLKNVRPFITALDWSPGASVEAVGLDTPLTPAITPQQLSLFG